MKYHKGTNSTKNPPVGGCTSTRSAVRHDDAIAAREFMVPAVRIIIAKRGKPTSCPRTRGELEARGPNPVLSPMPSTGRLLKKASITEVKGSRLIQKNTSAAMKKARLS